MQTTVLNAEQTSILRSHTTTKKMAEFNWHNEELEDDDDSVAVDLSDEDEDSDEINIDEDEDLADSGVDELDY